MVLIEAVRIMESAEIRMGFFLGCGIRFGKNKNSEQTQG
ncbi:hypothetical protein LEP1GSC195_2091 [Leptospira wolbachii serovar Codice str. CDC]|uniref:Uncharacterized protein n=1 Tax=Leptospira wolbachii serovar Codice str. CDC TaxID=1218599 RepID=R9A0Y5_9LEPT|nr:hypothetical protein LEP1GSC195_2091 [Leptospira wolbachii serovar Codice str. CDC]